MSVSTTFLRPDQEIGINFLTSRRNAGCFDEMGTGKTRQASVTIQRVGTLRNLIITPKIVARHWRRELGKVYGPVFDGTNIDQLSDAEVGVFIALGSQEDRKNTFQQYQVFKTLKPNVPLFLITNYHNQLDALEFEKNWESRVLDECHNIKNSETTFFKAVKKFRTLHDYLLTGTPTSQGPRDLFSYLNIVDENKFRAFWPYVRKYCFVQNHPQFGTYIGGAKNPKELRDITGEYFIRRLKKDVLPALKKTRTFIEVEPHPRVRKLYNQLEAEQLAETDSGDLVIIDHGAIRTLRHRQLLVAPQILGFDLQSSTLEAVNELISEANGPCVVFTTFKEAIPWIEKSIRKMDKSHHIDKIHGGMDYAKLDDIVQGFHKVSQKNRTLIATTQLSQGYEVLCSGTAIFAGPDYSNIFNLQSEDRLPRPGNPNHVNCFYIINSGTVEEDVVERVEEKVAWDNQSFRTLKSFEGQ